MELNCTLFVQTVNFVLAYLLLRKFLFDPVIATIARDERADDAIRAEAVNAQHTLGMARQQYENSLHACRSYFARHAPHQQVLHVSVSQDTVVPLVDQAEVRKQAEAVSVYLVQRVSRGN